MSEGATPAPSEHPVLLRVEYLPDALGIGERHPRLSWRLPSGASRQFAYQVATDGGEVSAWIESASSSLVPWPFAPLSSRQRVAWRVRTLTDAGESLWSDEAAVEAGLLDVADWQARWISPAEEVVAPPGERPAYELEGLVTVHEAGIPARLYATAQGLYECFINGRRVGDSELTPGYTQYTERLQVQTYDVTDLLVPGVNVVSALLSDGWFRGRVGLTRAVDQWGDRTAFLCQLHVGSGADAMVAGTGPHWRSRASHILRADLMDGQAEDRRILHDPTRLWSPVEAVDGQFERLVASPAPPVRRIDEVGPLAVTQLGPRRFVVDFGQNINGWVRLSNLHTEGTTITLTHGEALDDTGDVTTEHLETKLSFLSEVLPLGQIDEVVSSGREGDVFEPRHTTHGFRYVRVDGHPTLTASDIVGVVVHTDMRRTGFFACSDDRLNRLFEAAVWSFRDNACDIPTDCPTRERSGWTGDWQVFAPTAAFLFDVAGFSAKWLRDVRSDQAADGKVANFSPLPPSMGGGSPLGQRSGSAGWGDATVIVPWEMYRAYGDIRLLAEHWSSMVAWLDYAQRSAASGRHPDRVARSATPLPHERFVWDTGFHWGEWLEPGEVVGDYVDYFVADKADTATAYFAFSAHLMARIAGVLGKADHERRYDELARSVREAWCAEFLAADGRVVPATQANLVRALRFDLVPHAARPGVARQLGELVTRADLHLQTGFLATASILPALADEGRLDLAYGLLLQSTSPSWIGMLERGATTIWESWDGIDDAGRAHESLNHYSKGAAISFLPTHIAGIRLPAAPRADEAGYRRVTIAPRPGGGLTWARASIETAFGALSSWWRIDDDEFILEVVIPAGTTADIHLPDGSYRERGAGRFEFRTLTAAFPSLSENDTSIPAAGGGQR